MSRSARWLAYYEEGLEEGLEREQAAAFAINKERDLLEDYFDMKYQQMKEDRDED